MSTPSLIRLEALLSIVKRCRLRLAPVAGIVEGRCTCPRGAQCSKPGKHPILKGWPEKATGDERQLRAWARQFPTCNWGIACGGPGRLLVLDVDPRHSGDESLCTLEREHGELPRTVRTRTGGGGEHVFLRVPEGVDLSTVQIRNSVGALGPGLDVRFDGGAVVAPGSVHVSGRKYEWKDGHHPDKAPIAEAPKWLLDSLTRPSTPRAAGTEPASGDPPAPIPEGQRNATLTRLGGAMRRQGAGIAAIEAALLAENAARCRPLLLDDEVGSIALSVSRYAPTEVGEAQPRPLRLQAHTVSELKSRPAPKWLVADVLVEVTLAALVGNPGVFKSFGALDIALCVASGVPWAGRAVERGPVLYISAEGSALLAKRICAWEEARGITAPDTLRIITEPVVFVERRDVTALLAILREWPEPPRLIIVDTLSRCMSGDENSAEAMMLFIGGLDQVRRETGATVLILHHVARASGRSRGSTALPGALDTIITLDRQGNLLTVACEKQKDFAEFSTFTLAAREVTLDDGESSLVLDPLEGSRTDLAAVALRVVSILADCADESGLTATEWKAACEEAGVKKTAFFQGKKDAVRRGYVIPSKKGRGARFTVDEAAWSKVREGPREGSRTNDGEGPLGPRASTEARTDEPTDERHGEAAERQELLL